jgi:large subunit ribosomal protein L15
MVKRLPRTEKRIRQMRGQGGAGYGGKKRHRGKGSQGGKGWAGSTKHKRSYVYKYAPYHFGYKGFRPPAGLPEDFILNLDDVEKIAAKEGKKEIDLTAMGYTKLLGRGKLTRPLAIKIARASAAAKEAVESAGGKLLLEEIAEEKEAAEKKA